MRPVSPGQHPLRAQIQKTCLQTQAAWRRRLSIGRLQSDRVAATCCACGSSGQTERSSRKQRGLSPVIRLGLGCSREGARRSRAGLLGHIGAKPKCCVAAKSSPLTLKPCRSHTDDATVRHSRMRNAVRGRTQRRKRDDHVGGGTGSSNPDAGQRCIRAWGASKVTTKRLTISMPTDERIAYTRGLVCSSECVRVSDTELRLEAARERFARSASKRRPIRSPLAFWP